MVVTPGYVGIGDKPNEVVDPLRQTLPDDLYRMTIVGQGTRRRALLYYGPDGKPVPPLTNTAGMPVGFGEITSGRPDAYWDGVNFVWNFNLTLAPQVTAVVPQPITRNADGVTLSQARNQIRSTSATPWIAASAQTLDFYSLIATGNTANTADDVVVHPTAAVYDSDRQDGHAHVRHDDPAMLITDLAQLGIGLPPADRRPYQADRHHGRQGGDIVTTDR